MLCVVLRAYFSIHVLLCLWGVCVGVGVCGCPHGHTQRVLGHYTVWSARLWSLVGFWLVLIPPIMAGIRTLWIPTPCGQTVNNPRLCCVCIVSIPRQVHIHVHVQEMVAVPVQYIHTCMYKLHVHTCTCNLYMYIHVRMYIQAHSAVLS